MSKHRGGQEILVAMTTSQPPIISIKIVSSSRTDAGATVSMNLYSASVNAKASLLIQS